MSSRPSWALAGALQNAFAARRIYIRTGGNTRYLSLRPAAQIGGAMAIAALLGWTGFTTMAFVADALDGHSARVRLETMSGAYQVRLAAYDARQRSLEERLNQANERRDAITGRLSDKQARLIETANHLQESDAELAVLREEFIARTDARRDDAIRIAALESELAGLRLALAGAETSAADLDGALATLGGAISEVIAERDRAVGESIRLGGEVARLTGSIGRMADRHERLLSRLDVAARTGLAGLETLFGRSNIDLDRILAQARRDYSGSGGPFVPLTAADGDAAGDTRVAALMENLETVNLMRFAAERLPFGSPVIGGRRTSGFGPRGRSMHTGLDIAAPRGTPIYATADGIVTFAGRQRGYGRVVKIRHAFGFETVYAHLNRARVKVGQRVGRGDRIGDMGSTGRSTGNHVHYEIRIDNKPVNPVKFIEAARDVL
ncbi:MAG: peptidoglycan DD-metalloendopeptidase family protein [Proteobacteria bacterium]|nr:peptidoglycan DD-metalloendopeptidase family protein [Pseudomonadota bacterium]